MPATAAPQDDIRINEVESNGGSPGDWVELVNKGTGTVDVGGWVIKDNDNAHSFTIASGTTIPAGGFRAFDVESAYGLGSSDQARLFLPGGTLVDSYTWTSHASTTYGRCPDATGSFVTTAASTKGAANSCPAPAPGTWPGGSSVSNADNTNAFGTNLSDLSFQDASNLWAVKNGPSTLYRLAPSGSVWTANLTKSLRYANGSGDPDAEGVTYTPDGLFVATERDNNNSGSSLRKVLKFDPSAAGSTINATAEWNLTPDLPSGDPNEGLEAITYVPDSYLTAHGFRDQHTGAAYNPASYSGHGNGLFFVGLESNGQVYAYALTGGGSYTRVASFSSGHASVMALSFDANTGHLWSVCDDTCSGHHAILDLGGSGDFAVTAVYNRPSGMPNYNNEGFAISPTCSGGTRQTLWADDSNDSSHALRKGTLNC
ncbi:hypothetical protein D5S17_12590 [Pseudonocardiaceae bacterium YIM PH 21723]|nr:hypothetical protein D5S17_12590 [Pseudonocardiaceae bacterium YIM PH 21723]